MEIIPVVDIKDGFAVHAVKGQRSDYRPVQSSLCPSSAPEDVIARFVELGDFQKVYIADLNSIMKQGNNDAVINRMTNIFPELVFWVDNGFVQTSFLSQPATNYVPIVGSESLHENSLTLLETIRTPYVLSLDYSSKGQLGPEQLFMNDRYWPDSVIVMTLGRVGNDIGPDFERLAYLSCRYPNKNFIAAGGIRNIEDLLKLKKLGIETALVASALHAKSISVEDIKHL